MAALLATHERSTPRHEDRRRLDRRLRGLGQWRVFREHHGEGRAPASARRFDAHGSAVGFDVAAHDRKAQPGAADSNSQRPERWWRVSPRV